MKRELIAFFLELFPFYLSMFVLETVAAITRGYAAVIVSVIVMIAYYFICQFFLWRGHPKALFKD